MLRKPKLFNKDRFKNDIVKYLCKQNVRTDNLKECPVSLSNVNLLARVQVVSDNSLYLTMAKYLLNFIFELFLLLRPSKTRTSCTIRANVFRRSVASRP